MMRFRFYSLLTFFLAFTGVINAQDGTQKQSLSDITQITVTDFSSESQPSDKMIYIVGDKYYVASSFESLTTNLKIDPKNDIDHVNIVDASNPYSQAVVEELKCRLPEKYRNNIKGIFTIYLVEKLPVKAV